MRTINSNKVVASLRSGDLERAMMAASQVGLVANPTFFSVMGSSSLEGPFEPLRSDLGGRDEAVTVVEVAESGEMRVGGGDGGIDEDDDAEEEDDGDDDDDTRS